jgi:dCTP diphosphatase
VCAMTDPTTTVGMLRERVAAFVAQRQWQRYHDAKNLSMSIAIEAAELMEHFQWARSDELSEVMADPAAAEVADELADILAFVLALANATGIDLAAALERKMEKNELKYPADEFRGRYSKVRTP